MALHRIVYRGAQQLTKSDREDGNDGYVKISAHVKTPRTVQSKLKMDDHEADGPQVT